MNLVLTLIAYLFISNIILMHSAAIVKSQREIPSSFLTWVPNVDQVSHTYVNQVLIYTLLFFPAND
jgi:hypothetical protein